MWHAVRTKVEKMLKQNEADRGEDPPDRQGDGPGSDTERFLAVVDPTHNEAVTGESGVPRRQRDHELKCQRESLDEFS